MSIASRPLGRSGLQVPILGFGAATLGDVYGKLSPQAGNAAVRYAVERGITLFDVSPYYGKTLAEKRLGQALKGLRDRVILMSKCGRYDLENFDFSRQRILSSVEESLTRLGCDSLDVFFAHDVEFAKPGQILEETLPALQELKQAGKARFVGITGLPVEELRMLAETAEPGAIDVMLSYCHANLLDDAATKVLSPYCREHGIGLVNASPLHMGILSGTEAPAWHPAPQEIRALGTRLAALCAQYGASLPELALHFAVQQSSVDTTLCGMKTVDEVDANLRAIKQAPNQDLLEQVQALIGDLKNRSWASG